MQMSADEPGYSFLRPFLLLFTISLFFWTGVNGLSAILPLHMQALGLSERLAGWLMGLGSLAALGAQLALGGLIDRQGPRLALGAGGLLLLLAVLGGHPVLGVAGQFLLNLLMGIGLTLVLIAGLSAAATIAPTTKRGTVVAWYGMANSLSSLIAAPLLTPIFLEGGFLLVQLSVGFCGLASALLALFLRTQPESSPPEEPREQRLLLPSAIRPGLLGALLAIGAGGFMLLAPLRAQALGLANPGLYLMVEAGFLILGRLAFGTLSDKRGRGWAILPGLGALAAGFILMGAALPPSLLLLAPALVGIGLGATGTGLIAWTVERAAATERGRAINTYYLFYELALFLGMTGVGYGSSLWAERSYMMIASLLLLGLPLYAVQIRARE